MLSNDNLKKMSELDIIKLIKNPETSSRDYNLAANFIINKYSPMIHKHWWMLQRQMNSSSIVNSFKDEYYLEAYEALFKAIQKVDLSRIYDGKFKLMQLASWYISNVRAKYIRETKKKLKIKSIDSLNDLDRNNVNISADPDVEISYWENCGYKESPEYQVCEIQEGEAICRRAIKYCMKKWTPIERQIFKQLQKGVNKNEIARVLNISSIKVYNKISKMKQDMRLALQIC